MFERRMPSDLSDSFLLIFDTVAGSWDQNVSYGRLLFVFRNVSASHFVVVIS